MDWKQMPELPGWLQVILAWVSLFIGVAVGTIAKIADDVKNGDRRKFWSKNLWLDFPALLMMYFIALGAAEWFNLHMYGAMGLSAFLGWLGPRAVDIYLGWLLRKNGAEKMIEHNGRVLFSEGELRCKGTGVLKLAPGFAKMLKELRIAFGEPMTVNSCCRAPSHNQRVGGLTDLQETPRE